MYISFNENILGKRFRFLGVILLDRESEVNCAEE